MAEETGGDIPDFRSVTRALKICSLALLYVQAFQVPALLSVIGKLAGLYHDMMGNTPVPISLTITRFLLNEMPFVMIGIIIMLACATVITKKAKGGLFLYINCGCFLLVWGALSLLGMFARSAVQGSIDALNVKSLLQ